VVVVEIVIEVEATRIVILPPPLSLRPVRLLLPLLAVQIGRRFIWFFAKDVLLLVLLPLLLLDCCSTGNLL